MGKRTCMVDAFWQRVQKSDGCWEWMGTKRPFGYGYMTRSVLPRSDGRPRNKHFAAHRVSWELHHGPIPEGLQVCHHCDNPGCVRPDHLFLGTARDNVHDKIRKGRERYVRHYGEDCVRAKLTEADVREIRARRAAGERPVDIAKDYNVSDEQVSRISQRRSWAHVA